jgi:hypothetical protein
MVLPVFSVTGLSKTIYQLEKAMRTLTQNEVTTVAGAGFADLVKVLVNVVAKPEGSTNVDVKAPFTRVLVNVIWGKK